MNKNLEKFLRKRNQAINNPRKYKDIYLNNIEELYFFIQYGHTQRGTLKNEILPISDWEMLDSELSIPCNYYEMDAQASFVEKRKLDFDKLAFFYSMAIMET
ncbi:hypothetical protein [Pseudoalteromonas rhizosphaerae]|uniref:hypothetical protein n=1 Tax=Pseudoalteromonas rhizosphaerae TaxID=2518973 RepID=UPI002148A451|nr:hypothetical protein [Pseudoalteromonas rhizosphaerae]